MKQELAGIWNLKPYVSIKLALFQITDQKYVFYPQITIFSLATAKFHNILTNSHGEWKLKIKFCTKNNHLLLLIPRILLKSEFRNPMKSDFRNSESCHRPMVNSEFQRPLPENLDMFFDHAN